MAQQPRSFIPDDTPSSFIPDEQPSKPSGFGDKALDFGRRFLFGPTAEEMGLPADFDVRGSQPQEIPGVSKGFDWLAEKIDPSNTSVANRGFLRPFAAGALQGIGHLIASGTDPRNVAPSAIPVRTGEVVNEPFVSEIPPINKPRLTGQIGEPKQLTTRIPEGPVRGPETFYGGPGGLAINRPHLADIRPFPPESLSGTVLPRELEGIRPVNPLLPANYGLGGQAAEGPMPEFPAKSQTESPQPELPVKQEETGLEKPQFEEPLFARSEQGGIKTGVNVKRSAAEVTSGYSRPLESIMVREGMQNAIDAVRDLGPQGKIDVKFGQDEKGNFIEIADNGSGLTRDQLDTVFSDINETGKLTAKGATGGKGIGKASYQRGGQYFWAQTVALEGGKKVKYTLYGTPEEFDVHIPVDKEIVPKNTPTGTIIRTHLKPDQSLDEANGMLRSILRSTRGVEANITTQNRRQTFPTQETFHQGGGDKIAWSGQVEGHNVKIIIPGNALSKSRPSRYIDVNYLNNGMYQFDTYHSLKEEAPFLPDQVLVDINPTAEEGDPNYPFPTQRESVKDLIKEKINKLLDIHIAKPLQDTRKHQLVELYKSMGSFVPTTQTSRKAMFFDPGSRLTPNELSDFHNSPVIQRTISLYDDAINDMLQSVGNQKWIDRLEGVGIVLDSNMHGVHIPNPDSGKSTILINPFEWIGKSSPRDAALETVITMQHEVAHIGDDTPTTIEVTPGHLQDPRIGRYLASYIDHIAKHGGSDVGHDFGFTKRLGEVYAKYGPEKAFTAADLLEEFYTQRNSGGYSPEVQRLLQVYQDSRGRPEVTTDFLSGTGVKQKTGGTGGGNIQSDDQPNAAGALAKLRAAIRNGKLIAQEQKEVYGAERAERIDAARNVRDKGRTGFYKQKAKLAGEMPKVDFKALQLGEEDIDALFGTIRDSKRVTEWNKISAQEGLEKLLTGTAPLQRSEMLLLGRVFGKDVEQEIMQMYGGLGAIEGFPRMAMSIANVMKPMMTFMDYSAPFNQGYPMVYTKRFWESFVPMIKAGYSQEFFDASAQALESSPLYEFLKGNGLYIADTETLANLEEAYGSHLAAKIPVMRGSERAYLAFLNNVRYKVAEDLTLNAFDAGLDPYNNKELVRKIVQYVNDATGRGSLGRFEKIGYELGQGFFSPRTVTSTAAFFDPRHYIGEDPFIRKQYLKSILAMGAIALGVDGVAKLAGADVTFNPFDPDFMKAKFGNTRLNPLGRFQSLITASARFLRASGKLANGTLKYNENTPLEIGGRFARSKEAPLAALITDILYGKNYVGEKTTIPSMMAESDKAFKEAKQFGPSRLLMNEKADFLPFIPKEIRSKFTPLFVSDMIDVAKDNPRLLWMGIPAIFGMPTQTYEDKPPPSSLRLR